MSVFNTWLTNKVSGLIIAGSIILINLEEIPSSPQLFFWGKGLYRLPNHLYRLPIYVYSNNTWQF